MNLSIRRVQPSDAPALTRICLLTGDAGESAEALHSADHQDLLALVYALPYVHPSLASCTSGFVLVSHTEGGGGGGGAADGEVVGYVLYASDTRAFERLAEEAYWPALRARHPLPAAPAPEDRALTAADARMITLLHTTASAFPAATAAVAFAPAHLHIDVLPAAQRRGWGRALVGAVVRELAARGARGVWVGLDPRNAKARAFYARLGFGRVEGAPDSYMGLRFEDWDAGAVRAGGV